MDARGFDPLGAKYQGNEEVVIKALKREIQNILDSYVGWYDPFCEMIQNALDSVETRQRHEKEKYSPCINVIIDIKNSILTVSDNGIGFEENQYLKFLAPNFSFKSGNTRGHKGVGSTYLAYGFNYIQIATKSASFEAVGKMENAKNWLSDENPSGNPRVVPDDAAPKDDEFMNFDRGVSISIRYDSSSYPSDLSWIKVSDAESWLKILRIKTGLGAIIPNNSISILVKVISKTGETTTASHNGIRFLHATEFIPKTISYSEIKNITDELYAKHGKDFRMPAKLENLDAIYDTWDTEILEKEVALDEAEKKIVETHSPRIEFIYVYSVKVWDKFNQSLGLRANLAALAGGIQISADNMPQGELIIIPLKKNAGRQFQLHIIIHFDKCRADLGRKGFQKEYISFSESIAKKIADGPIQRVRHTLRKNAGASPNPSPEPRRRPNARQSPR